MKILTTPNDQTSHFALQSPVLASGGMYGGVPFLDFVTVKRSVCSTDSAYLNARVNGLKSAT